MQATSPAAARKAACPIALAASTSAMTDRSAHRRRSAARAAASVRTSPHRRRPRHRAHARAAAETCALARVVGGIASLRPGTRATSGSEPAAAPSPRRPALLDGGYAQRVADACRLPLQSCRFDQGMPRREVGFFLRRQVLDQVIANHAEISAGVSEQLALGIAHTRATLRHAVLAALLVHARQARYTPGEFHGCAVLV